VQAVTKLAITIDLNELERLMKEYVAEELAGDQFLLQQMQLGHFLLWLTHRQRRKRQETTDEQTRTKQGAVDFTRGEQSSSASS